MKSFLASTLATSMGSCEPTSASGTVSTSPHAMAHLAQMVVHEDGKSSPQPSVIVATNNNKIILDSPETPVWYRRLPRLPATPPAPIRAFSGVWAYEDEAMADSRSAPATNNMPSPAPSDSSSSTQNAELDPPPRYSSGRHGRSPTRMQLRTGFRGFQSMATVVVGDAKGSRPAGKYLIHKDLITSASPFFAAALNSTFAEGLDQTVHLPEEKPEIFEWFLQWLYTGSLTTHVSGIHYSHLPAVPPHPTVLPASQFIMADARADGDLRNTQGSPKYFLLIDLYGLSDRLLTPELSNHVLNTIARLSETTNSVPTPSDTRILYEHIRETSNLKALILDLFAYKKTDKLLATHKDEWHARFLRDLCVKLKRPGPEALERHTLVSWRPRSWNSVKGCEGCRELLKPDVSSDRCCVCEKAFCSNCVRRGSGERGIVLGEDTAGCKPWTGRGMCLRYHEHPDGESCAV